MGVLIDNPFKFFKKTDTGVVKSFLYLFIFSSIFVLLNEASVRAGFTKYVPTTGIAESAAFGIAFIIIGAAVLSAVLKMMLKKEFSKAFSIISYSSTPLMLIGWIPFAAVSAVAIIWSFLFVGVGIHVKGGVPYRKSFKHAGVILIIGAVILAMSQFMPMSAGKIPIVS